jgi:hypothetical protein
MTRAAWFVTWPVFANAFVLCATLMVLLGYIDRLSAPGHVIVTSQLSSLLGIWAGIWLAHCANTATTEAWIEYLGQLPDEDRRLRTLVADSGFAYLLILLVAWWLCDAVWPRPEFFDSPPRYERELQKATSPAWLDVAVLAPLSYWATLAVELRTRSMARHWASSCRVLTAVVLVVLPMKRHSMLRGEPQAERLIVLSYGVLAAAAALTIIVRWHARVVLKNGMRRADLAKWAT